MSRQQGIVISDSDPAKTSYAEITRKLKEKINLDELSVKVTELRRTNKGPIIMSVGKGEQRAIVAQKLKEAVEAALGPDVGVWLQTNLTRLEIQDISSDDDVNT